MAFTQRAHQKKLFHKFYRTGKRTPKPEEMFEPLIRAGLAYIHRRPYQPPQLVFTEKFYSRNSFR